MFTELTRELLDLTATEARRTTGLFAQGHRLLLSLLLRLPFPLPLMFEELTNQLLDLRATTLGDRRELSAMVLDCCCCCCCYGFHGW